MKQNEAVIAAQIARLTEAFKALLPAGTSYALVDFPDHPNVGDSAIWLGEVCLLSHLTGRPPAYVCTMDSFSADDLRDACPEGPILIHGGGNFGDLWPKHQIFREMILERYRDRLIIQLPQSIKFRDESAIGRCAEVIASHPRFLLWVRDAQSLALARSHFDCPSELLPDSAFALGPTKRPVSPNREAILLLRTDHERTGFDRAPFAQLRDSAIVDWLDEPHGFGRRGRLRKVLDATFGGSRSQRQFSHYQQLASGRVERGMRLLASGRQVITDRLHAHILSTLLDIPHVTLDNDYGKISGYIGAWTSGYPGLQMAANADEAIDRLKLLPYR